MRRQALLGGSCVLATAIALGAWGCSVDSGLMDGFSGGGSVGGGSVGGGSGDFGATPGGVQDMGLARALIEQGRVPPPEAFNVEGMFSEHDLPLEGSPCETTLCLRGAMGLAPDEDDVQSAWLQVGFSSTIDPQTYERPSLTVVGTVDVSGSMTGTPLAVAKAMLHALVDELLPTDSFGIVQYGDAAGVVLPVTAATDLDALHRSIDSLQTGGSTNMEQGLDVAFRELRRNPTGTDLRRVWLFTDVQPNVGATSASQFEAIVLQAAQEGIGLTVFGVGLGLGQEVLVGMSHLRGGNAFSIFSEQDVVDLMEESWPWLACPIAYDLHLSVAAGSGLELAEAYGIPTADDAEAVTLDVATIFLSRKKGAILLRFDGEEGALESGAREVALALRYTGVDGEAVVDHLSASVSADVVDARGMTFSQPSVEKTIALAVLVRGMRAAAEAYGTDRDAAIAIMERMTARFDVEVEAIGDEALAPESELAWALLGLMRAGAAQGDLYNPGGY